VTGAEEPLELAGVVDVLDELHPAASRVAAATPAAISALLIVRLFSSFFSIKIVDLVGNLLYHSHPDDAFKSPGGHLHALSGCG
jgi:hypothetical protein